MGRLIRRSQEEKMEITHFVEYLSLSTRQTLEELDVPRSTFYRWYTKYQEKGYEDLAEKKSNPRQFWNRIPELVRQQVVDLALGFPENFNELLKYTNGNQTTSYGKKRDALDDLPDDVIQAVAQRSTRLPPGVSASRRSGTIEEERSP